LSPRAAEGTSRRRQGSKGVLTKVGSVNADRLPIAEAAHIVPHDLLVAERGPPVGVALSHKLVKRPPLSKTRQGEHRTDESTTEGWLGGRCATSADTEGETCHLGRDEKGLARDRVVEGDGVGTVGLLEEVGGAPVASILGIVAVEVADWASGNDGQHTPKTAL